MAGNIAHMIICKEALKRFAGEDLKQRNFITDIFGNDFTDRNRLVWANLGSLAPDLFYYNEPARALWLYYAGKYLETERMEPWSYHMHSVHPNVLPMKWIEITFRDAVVKKEGYNFEDIDYKKFAFVAGFLTHVATDQIIHQTANRLAGPYYRNGHNRELHREWEIRLDYHLYESFYRSKENDIPFVKQDFSRWAYFIDPSLKAIGKSLCSYVIKNPPSLFSNFLLRPVKVLKACVRLAAHHIAEEWFAPFLQRGFVETYGSFPEENTINASIFNLGLLLSTTRNAHPYKKAKSSYDNKYVNEVKYIDYFQGGECLTDYERAIGEAKNYLFAFYELIQFLKENRNLLNKARNKFLQQVRDIDLSCP